MLMNGLSVGGIESRGIESEGMKLHLRVRFSSRGDLISFKMNGSKTRVPLLALGWIKKNSTERPQSRKTGQPNLKLDLEA